jgi:hypothetical protein
MKVLAAFCFLLCASALGKNKPQVDYQDAVMVNFETIQSGSSCSSSGTVRAEEDSSGNVTGSTNGNTDCVANTVRHYTVAVGGHTYTIRPALTKGKAAVGMATLGWSTLFEKSSVLANLLPGTHVLVRTDESGFYVRVGKRESKYAIVGAK